MSTTTHTDITDVILRQHADVAARLDAVAEASGRVRADEFEELAHLLDVHESAEEHVVYPALREFGPDGVRIADERTDEETAASQVLMTLKSLPVDSDEFQRLFLEFRTKVHGHAANEEATVLPMLSTRMDDETRTSMGDAFLDAQTDD